MHMKKILIIEDDPAVAGELVTLMQHNGYDAEILSDSSGVGSLSPADRILASAPDLILLDINLPGMDGEMLLRELRKESQVPVIMVTSRNTEMDEVFCMSLGADDFIAKPYNPSILLLHIEAVFKRTDGGSSLLKYENIILDTGRGTMDVNGKLTDLSRNEMKILVYMIQHAGTIVSRDALISYLWDTEEFVDDNTLTVNMNRVRKKLEDSGYKDIIRTKRGQGYLLG